MFVFEIKEIFAQKGVIKPYIGLQNTPLQKWIKKEDVNLTHEMITMTPEKKDKMKEFYKELKVNSTF